GDEGRGTPQGPLPPPKFEAASAAVDRLASRVIGSKLCEIDRRRIEGNDEWHTLGQPRSQHRHNLRVAIDAVERRPFVGFTNRRSSTQTLAKGKVIFDLRDSVPSIIHARRNENPFRANGLILSNKSIEILLMGDMTQLVIED